MQIVDVNGFAEDFKKYYLDRGFGSMNKNDFEVLFFYLLQTYGNLQEKSVFGLAKELQISESKVKRLSYEADLKYRKEDDTKLRERFLSLLDKANLQKDNATIRFVVEDKYLRSSIYNDMKLDGDYLDYSFNSEIVSIHKNALIRLLDKYYSEAQKDDLIQAYKRVRRDVKMGEFRTVMNTLFKDVVEGKIENVDFKKLIGFISKGAAGIAGIADVFSSLPM